ncbi:hypothetical protein ACNOYE_26535 [Nannocystaceae bacterium ST9]
MLSAVVAASQSACVVPFECIYYTYEGYQICANLEPVISSDRAGEVAVVDDLGNPPAGCTCMHPDTVEIFEADPLDPQLDPIYEQIGEDARVICEELALQLLVDPTPCETAKVDENTASKGANTTSKCPFVGDMDDEDKDGNCPPFGAVDEVGYTTDTTDTDGGGVVVIPDLPFEPLP